MDISAIVLGLHPSAIPLTDFSISQPYGASPYISKWNTEKLGPVPSQTQLEAAWPEVQLAQARLAQMVIIKQGFLSTVSAPVTDGAENIWEGGMTSGSSIFLACQLAQQQGATSITLYDAAKAPHSMTIAEGMSVAALIGAAYQAALGQKNTLYAQIAAAPTVADVQAVVWP